MLDDEKLVELLVKRDDLLEQGKDSSPEEVCEDCPELADEFRDRLANLKASDWMFQSDDGQEGDGTWELPVPAALPPPDPPLPASSLTISEFRQSVTRSGLMTAEEMEHIFSPEYTTKEKGLGLGLPLSHEIIRGHGGEIRVTSRKDEGTTFEILLPTEKPGNKTS